MLLLLLFICTFLPSEARSAMSLAVEMRSLLNMWINAESIQCTQYSIFNYLFTWGLLALLFAARTRRQLKEWNGNTPAITTSLHDNDDDRARHDAHTHTDTCTHTVAEAHTQSVTHVLNCTVTQSVLKWRLASSDFWCAAQPTRRHFPHKLIANSPPVGSATSCGTWWNWNTTQTVQAASRRQQAAAAVAASSCHTVSEWVSFPATLAGGSAARAFCFALSHARNVAEYINNSTN